MSAIAKMRSRLDKLAATRGHICPSLPSATVAYKLVAGDVVAGVPGAIATTLFRASLIGAGMWLAGARDKDALKRQALGGALMVEASVIGYAWWRTYGIADKFSAQFKRK